MSSPFFFFTTHPLLFLFPQKILRREKKNLHSNVLFSFCHHFLLLILFLLFLMGQSETSQRKEEKIGGCTVCVCKFNNEFSLGIFSTVRGSYLFRNWCDFLFFFSPSASFRLMFNECQVMHSFKPLKVLFFKTKFWFKIKCIDASVSLKLIFPLFEINIQVRKNLQVMEKNVINCLSFLN